MGTFFSLPALVMGVFPEVRFGFERGELLAHGFRGHGETMFGDVGFIF